MTYLLADILNQYLSDCRGKSSKTILSYTNVLTDLREYLGDTEVMNITSEHLQSYLNTLSSRSGRKGSFSQHSISKYFAVIRTFCIWMYEKNLTERNLIHDVQNQVHEKPEEPEGLSRREIVQLLQTLKGCPFRDLVLFEVLLDTGLKTRELTALDVKDVKFETHDLFVLAGIQRGRNIPIGRKVQRDLRTYLSFYRNAVENENALFTNKFGMRLKSDGLEMLVKRYLYKIRPTQKHGAQVLRDTFALEYLKNGGRILDLHAILGNKDMRSTYRYVQVNNGGDKNS